MIKWFLKVSKSFGSCSAVTAMIIVLNGTILKAQSQELVFAGDSVKDDVIFVGEVHSIKNLPDFRYKIFEYAYTRFGTADIVIEESKSNAYIYNLYLQTRDTLLLGSDYEFNTYIKGIAQLTDKYKIAVRMHGMDFERIELVKVLRYIFEHCSDAKCRETELYKYLSSLPVDMMTELESASIYNSKTRRKIARIRDHARMLFDNEKDKLQVALGDNYKDVADIVCNPVTINFKTRDRNMLTNIIMDSSLNKNKFICFTGRFHMNIKQENSLCSRYIRWSSNSQKVSTISLMCTKCSKKFPYSGLPNGFIKNDKNVALMNNNKVADSYKILSIKQFDNVDMSEYLFDIPMHYMFF